MITENKLEAATSVNRLYVDIKILSKRLITFQLSLVLKELLILGLVTKIVLPEECFLNALLNFTWRSSLPTS